MIHELLDAWRKRNGDVAKLQYVYAAVVVVLVVVAGLIALLNRDVSERLLAIIGALMMVLVVNLVTWSLVGGFVQPSRSRSRK